MAQKPVLRVEVGARALRVRSVSREEAWASAGVQVSWVLSRLGRAAESEALFVVVPPPQGLCKAPHDPGNCWKQFNSRHLPRLNYCHIVLHAHVDLTNAPRQRGGGE